ncbi:phosphoribosyltransferase [Acidiferrobacter sp.]|uniref:phosphoribosyltransferase n=1 Tax=Acidiferrobacter sp. TaxID=1872107 RepID=UPI00261D8AF2|nr:phosphoribosyltransferase family protein [Acidiferrobacter sp.]
MDGYFRNRADAGARLARALPRNLAREDVLVLALPRGGVPVGYAVAQALGAEFDVLLVRKLGVPDQPELAMGAIASGGTLYINEPVRAAYHIRDKDFERVLAEERAELRRREKSYRGDRPPARLLGRTVVVVDDGIATGASMRTALLALRSGRPGRIIVAVPVAPADARMRFSDLADDFISVYSPRDFSAVGQFYEDFGQTEDEEVHRLLAESAKEAMR